MQRRQVKLCRQLDNVSHRLHSRRDSAHLEVVALSIEQHTLTVETADAFEIIWRPVTATRFCMPCLPEQACESEKRAQLRSESHAKKARSSPPAAKPSAPAEISGVDAMDRTTLTVGRKGPFMSRSWTRWTNGRGQATTRECGIT